MYKAFHTFTVQILPVNPKYTLNINIFFALGMKITGLWIRMVKNLTVLPGLQILA